MLHRDALGVFHVFYRIHTLFQKAFSRLFHEMSVFTKTWNEPITAGTSKNETKPAKAS